MICFLIFDGFGTARQSAERAVELGQEALSLTNHGNVSGLVEHYQECNKVGIKPILGVEAYFQPKFNKKSSRFHLTLLAKNLTGYSNIMRLMTEASTNNFYRTPIVTFNMLKECHEGIICGSGCMIGLNAQLVYAKKTNLAKKFIRAFYNIFEDDFFLEMMPNELPAQLASNVFNMKMSKKLGIKAVLTHDSHYPSPEDFDTYQVMHKLAKSTIGDAYKTLYMPSAKDISRQFRDIHGVNPREYVENACYFADKCDVDLTFKEVVPHYNWGIAPKEKLRKLVIKGLKAEGKTSEEYVKQAKHELKVIEGKSFEEYFLLIWDLINYAKSKDIGVGPGRGSVCGSLVAYALGITEVDPIILGTHFERFLRPDKNAMPDIDIDFDARRRDEVLQYILEKNKGRSAPICTFGYYKIDNLMNELGKLWEVLDDDLKAIKDRLNAMIKDPHDVSGVLKNEHVRIFNNKYKGIIKHFMKLYGQVRFIGRHAAGIAVTDGRIDDMVALQRVRGELVTSYDLRSLGMISVLKIDALGLSTQSVISKVEELTNVDFRYDMLEDSRVYGEFAKGNTVGIFQFEKAGAISLLTAIKPDNFQDLVAVTALNRPAPITLGLHSAFLDGKEGRVDKNTPWFKYTDDTYGVLVYQEQVMKICRGLAHMEWPDIDKIMKYLRLRKGDKDDSLLKKKFVEGSKKYSNLPKRQAEELYDSMTNYLFNKGHGVGYTLISFYMMWLKMYYPTEFWYALMLNEENEYKREVYKANAIKQGIVVLLPHVNATADFSLQELDGERVIQEGISTIKGIGMKTAELIEESRPYNSLDLLQDRVPKRQLNAKVVRALEESGAIEFNMERYYDRVVRYNSTLYSKAEKMKVW